MTLYQECVAAGIPVHNHYSDLYIPSTPETRALVAKHGLRSTSFQNQVEGGIWLDIHAAYDPYWESKGVSITVATETVQKLGI